MNQVVKNKLVKSVSKFEASPSPYRVVSFLPSATEIMYFLGAFDNLVGLTTECDWPPEAKKLPKIVRPILNTDQMTSLEIEEEVHKLLQMRGELYNLDVELLNSLNPDIIISQNLCNVCSLVPDSFIKKLSRISKKCKIVSLQPRNVYEVIHDIEKVADILGIKERGKEIADNLCNQYLDIINSVPEKQKNKKKCVFIEWLNPIYIGGHWMGQVLKDLSAISIADMSGVPSKPLSPHKIADFNPDYIIVSPCGRKGDILMKETKYFVAQEFIRNTNAYRSDNIYLIPECFTAKPGPRIVEGAKIIYEILYKNNKTYRFTLN